MTPTPRPFDTRRRIARSALLLWALLPTTVRLAVAQPLVPLRSDLQADWEPAKAWRETTPTRERISINGLWRWRPTTSSSANIPSGSWGYFKVPGCWPGITDYMQKDSQSIHAHDDWKSVDLRRLTAAWYQREVSIPEAWKNRRVTLAVEYLNSFASVYVDGKKVGDLRFPGGDIDLSAVCRPGSRHVLSLLVVAMPLEGVRLAFTDTGSAKEVKGVIKRRGLCGDVWLTGEPRSHRISDVRIDTSVRRWEIGLDVGLEDTGAASSVYRLRAEILEEAETGEARRLKKLVSQEFSPRDLEAGRFRFRSSWKPERLWDVHTPRNTYRMSVSLIDDKDRVLDTFHEQRFGFRELWIDGRDFYLNGSRIFLSAVPLDNAQIGAALASYEGARESLERLRLIGINLVYTHNYGCEPGSHLSFAEILRAADDVGMLVSLSQPHFSRYRWENAGDDSENGYASDAEFYVRVAQNHPSVVFYGMSHNATGYSEDMDPDKLDGVTRPHDSWSHRNSQRALRAEAIVRRLDPSRIVYHHSSGNLSSMHTSNFYPNFVPRQELADWFERWATRGRKPIFLCEFGAPLSWDWTMYRGWYRGERAFGSARVPWELCIAEWNAQFIGDRAYRISEGERRNLRWEARQFRDERTWHRWDYPRPVGSNDFDERHPIFAEYFRDVWRAMRTWGVSAVCPWDYGHHWKVREGVDRSRKTLARDDDNLQRPGFRADYVERRYERFDLAFDRADWNPTVAGEEFSRVNAPVLAYIAGKPSRFTSKDHLFHAGETFEKQLIVLNNSRVTVSADYEWSLSIPQRVLERGRVRVETGEQTRVPIRVELPSGLAPGAYDLDVNVRLDGAGTLSDSFRIDIVPEPVDVTPRSKIALFDPQGETTSLLRRLGIAARPVDADDDLSAFDIVILGKSALTEKGPAPDLGRVRDGLRVIAFEQTAAVLEKRLGFRVAEYGLRRVYERLRDHPVLAGLTSECLRNWRGEATIVSPRLDYELRPRYGPTVRWCDIPVTRLWRCGSHGCVSSVLIEKPARGDFLPLLDGGFGLRYSPLLEHRDGRGLVIFCQMDVTGRTEDDPAADRFVRNLLAYVDRWQPRPERRVMYVGEPAGRRHLESAAVELEPFEPSRLSDDRILVVGPTGGEQLAAHARTVGAWIENGGRLLSIGLAADEVNPTLPMDVRTSAAEHISTFFEPHAADSPFAGIGPADLHNRDPRKLPLVTGGADLVGNGVLARAASTNAILFQMTPWRFDVERQNTKRVFRRTSFALSRLLGNLGVSSRTPLLERIRRPVTESTEKRWLEGLYLDRPEEWDDPYRFFRW